LSGEFRLAEQPILVDPSIDFQILSHPNLLTKLIEGLALMIPKMRELE
jgi:hypothetical protein